MGFPRQKQWSGWPFPSPGDLPNAGTEPCLPHCKQILYHLSHQGSLGKGPPKTSGAVLSEKAPDVGGTKGCRPRLRALEAVMRGPRAGPGTVSVYCLHVFLFAFLMKLSICIMVLAITGMCYEAALKASDKEKTCALPVLSPSLESVTGDKVGQSDL